MIISVKENEMNINMQTRPTELNKDLDYTKEVALSKWPFYLNNYGRLIIITLLFCLLNKFFNSLIYQIIYSIHCFQ